MANGQLCPSPTAHYDNMVCPDVATYSSCNMETEFACHLGYEHLPGCEDGCNLGYECRPKIGGNCQDECPVPCPPDLRQCGGEKDE